MKIDTAAAVMAIGLRSAAANRPKRSGHTQAAATNAQKLLVMIV
jgi:hypothetical protein